MATILTIRVVEWAGIRSHKAVIHLLSSLVVDSLLGADFLGAGLVDSSSISTVTVAAGEEDIDVCMGVVIVF